MERVLTEEQEQAIIERFILLVQTRNMPLAVELKSTLTLLDIHIPKIHDATSRDMYNYRQSAI